MKGSMSKKAVAAAPFHGVGRRKKAVARVWMRRGKGNITVNERSIDAYFDTPFTRDIVRTPLVVTSLQKDFDIQVNLVGGGLRGQADAAKLGIARALLTIDEALRPALKQAGLLTVDARVKERKKYGQRAARAKFQFVKR